jgi:hypothetical protein
VWPQSTSTCEILLNLYSLYLSDEFQIVPDTITDVGDVDLEKAARNLSCLFQDNTTQLSRANFGQILSRVSFLLLIHET